MLGSPRQAFALLAVAGVAVVACTSADRPGEVSLTTSSSDGRLSSIERGRGVDLLPGEVRTVLAVSIDGLNPAAIGELGPERAPTLHRLVAEGASTLNARTARELTDTLPNHTGMVTGRRVDAARGGHGVTWNDERLRPRTVHRAAGEDVGSVFRVVGSVGLGTALFAGKEKFTLFQRSWPADIDSAVIEENNQRLTRAVRLDLRDADRAFRLVHLSRPDVVGHNEGFMGEEYLEAVAVTDRRVGRLLATVEAHPDLAGHTVVVLTSDHGGRGADHRDPTRRADFTVPFLVWGAGVAEGADLYDLNPDYADPGRSRTRYRAEPPPIRNLDLANLVTDLLGLPAVEGSQVGTEQALDVG